MESASEITEGRNITRLTSFPLLLLWGRLRLRSMPFATSQGFVAFGSGWHWLRLRLRRQGFLRNDDDCSFKWFSFMACIKPNEVPFHHDYTCSNCCCKCCWSCLKCCGWFCCWNGPSWCFVMARGVRLLSCRSKWLEKEPWLTLDFMMSDNEENHRSIRTTETNNDRKHKWRS